MGEDRRFLDTSVARHLLTGSASYKKHLHSEIGPGPREVSDYVVMELRRSFLQNLIDFHACVDMPQYHTVGDAVKFWTNKFRGGELKAVLSLAGHLLDNHQLSAGKPEHKSTALRLIALYIKRQEMKVQGWNTGKDSTRCGRAAIPPREARLETTDYSFDHLCPPISQPHRRHLSAQAVEKLERRRASDSVPSDSVPSDR